MAKKTNKALQGIANRRTKAVAENKKASIKKDKEKTKPAPKKESKAENPGGAPIELNGLEYEKSILSRYKVSKQLIEAHTSKSN